jgi:hypothetical protein
MQGSHTKRKKFMNAQQVRKLLFELFPGLIPYSSKIEILDVKPRAVSFHLDPQIPEHLRQPAQKWFDESQKSKSSNS